MNLLETKTKISSWGTLVMIPVSLSLGNPRKDRQGFIDAGFLISASDWSVKLSNFENVADTPFEFGLQMSNDARFCQTALRLI